MRGVVKWFNDAKGYGFITPEESSKDVFVHHSKIIMEGRRKLVEGQLVDFTPITSVKGAQAVDVIPL